MFGHGFFGAGFYGPGFFGPSAGDLFAVGVSESFGLTDVFDVEVTTSINTSVVKSIAITDAFGARMERAESTSSAFALTDDYSFEIGRAEAVTNSLAITDLFEAYVSQPAPLVVHTAHEDDGLKVMVTTNLNDAHEIRLPANTVAGNSNSSFGPAQSLIVMAPLTLSNSRLGMRPAAHAFDALPSSPQVGDIAQVTNSSVTTIGDNADGNGGSRVLVWWNGSNWTVIGK